MCVLLSVGPRTNNGLSACPRQTLVAPRTSRNARKRFLIDDLLQFSVTGPFASAPPMGIHKNRCNLTVRSTALFIDRAHRAPVVIIRKGRQLVVRSRILFKLFQQILDGLLKLRVAA